MSEQVTIGFGFTVEWFNVAISLTDFCFVCLSIILYEVKITVKLVHSKIFHLQFKYTDHHSSLTFYQRVKKCELTKDQLPGQGRGLWGEVGGGGGGDERVLRYRLN